MDDMDSVQTMYSDRHAGLPLQVNREKLIVNIARPQSTSYVLTGLVTIGGGTATASTKAKQL